MTFAPIVFRQNNTKPKFNRRKAAQRTFKQKTQVDEIDSVMLTYD